MQLRDYQIDLVERTRVALRTHHAVVMQLGTGGGKTATAAEILRRAVERGHRAVFLAHLDTLIDDTYERLVKAGVWAGVVQAGRPLNSLAPVQVCSIQTLHRRGERPPAHLVIPDECHRIMAATARPILEAYPDADIIGLTATPQRGDGKPLGDVFQAIVCGPTVRELTRAGHLVPSEVISPPMPENDGLAMCPVEAYERFAPGTRAVVFAGNIAHVEQLVAKFEARGIRTATILGDTPREARHAAKAAIEAGDALVLVGVGVFIEGFDLPALETVILARAFSVCGSFLQAIGRGLRPFAGKTRCLVIDLRGASLLHGLPDEDRIWSLKGAAARRAEQMTALRRCKECLAIFRPAVECPRCGARGESLARLPRVLNRAEKMAKLSSLTQYERDQKYIASLKWIAISRLRKDDVGAEVWARVQFRRRFQREPEAA